VLKVAHLKEVYLPVSETFIYAYLVGMRGVESHVIVERLENEGLFPFDRKHVLSKETEAFRAYTRVIHKVTRSPKIHFAMMPRCPFAEKVVRRLKPDVAHAHGGYAGYRYVRIVRSPGVPYVTTFYGRDIGAGSRHPYWRKAYRLLFASGDLFLAEGPSMRNKLIKAGCPAGKVRLQRIGIDLEMFPLRRHAHSKRGESTVVLMCGRMVEKKGMEYGIRAFAEVRRRFRASEMRVIGDGPLLGDLRRLVSSLDLNGAVRFNGALSYSRYAALSREADIFIQPSITASDGDSEGGAPTTLLEMQALGMPVVSTYHDDIPEVVSEGKSGFLVKEKDVEALADRVSFLLANPDARVEMGREGRKLVEEKHDIRVLAKELQGVYSELSSRGTMR
jgi:colanic acid/amylovoran biosynthesis glycosyltransferase